MLYVFMFVVDKSFFKELEKLKKLSLRFASLEVKVNSFSFKELKKLKELSLRFASLEVKANSSADVFKN